MANNTSKILLAAGALIAGIWFFLLRKKEEAPPGGGTPGGAADIRLSNLTLDRNNVPPGTPVTVSVTATNVGTASGSKTVTLSGNFSGSKTVTLPPQQSTVVLFTVIPTAVGTYNITVDGLTASLVCQQAAPSTVTVTVKAYKPPAQATHWFIMTDGIYSMEAVPINDPIIWRNIPANSVQQGVLAGCGYWQGGSWVDVPCTNCGHSVGFSRLLEDGKTYYWDFSRGILLDWNYEFM
jgi:hypothetical protein